MKCPSCLKGDFLEANPYNLGKFDKVRERCLKYGLEYSIEPSFYYGSMYVSYAVGIAVAVMTYMITLIFGLDLGPLGVFLAIVIGLVLGRPYIGAVSKSIRANIFFKYDKNYC